MLKRLKELTENLNNELLNFGVFLENQELKAKILEDKRVVVKNRVRVVVKREAGYG